MSRASYYILAILLPPSIRITVHEKRQHALALESERAVGKCRRRTGSVEVPVLDDSLCQMREFAWNSEPRREQGRREERVPRPFHSTGRESQTIFASSLARYGEETHLSEVFFPMFVAKSEGAMHTTLIPDFEEKYRIRFQPDGGRRKESSVTVSREISRHGQDETFDSRFRGSVRYLTHLSLCRRHRARQDDDASVSILVAVHRVVGFRQVFCDIRGAPLSLFDNLARDFGRDQVRTVEVDAVNGPESFKRPRVEGFAIDRLADHSDSAAMDDTSPRDFVVASDVRTRVPFVDTLERFVDRFGISDVALEVSRALVPRRFRRRPEIEQGDECPTRDESFRSRLS